MKKIAVLVSVLFLLALGLAGCGGGGGQGTDYSAPPDPPSQEPGPQLTEHGAGWDEYKNGLDELTSIKGAIDQKYEELQRLKSPSPNGEPVFDQQASLKEEEILENCDTLEKSATTLLEQPYLRDHKGEASDAESLITYAREMRQKINSGG